MKRTLRLTESELVTLVKRIIDEQTKSETPLDLKNKNITVIVKSSPYQEVKGRIENIRDMGNNQKRISFILDNGDVGEAQYDSDKMEFDNYKIVKVEDVSVGDSKKVTPKPAKPSPKKKTPQLPDDFLKLLREPKVQQDFVLYRFDMGYSQFNKKVPVGIKILKDSIDYSNYPAQSKTQELLRITAKTTDGKSIRLDHRCGKSYFTISGGPFEMGLQVTNPALLEMMRGFCPQG